MNTAVTVEQTPPEAARAVRVAEDAYQLALAYQVDSLEVYQAAGEELRTIAAKSRELEETRLSLTRPLDESKRRIMDLFRHPLERLAEARRVIESSMVEFKRQQDEAERRAREEAERQAAAERQRIAAAEREAAEREAAALEEARRAAAEGDAEAAEAARTAASEAAAVREEAAAQGELADIAPPPVAYVERPRAAGVSTRQNWKAEVTDLGALVKAAAEALGRGDDSLLAFLQPNTTALGQLAKAMKAQARIPGVRVYAEESLAVRSR